MAIKLYRALHGISTIIIDDIDCNADCAIKLINIFKPERIVTKVTALDYSESVLKAICNNRFLISFPEKDTVISETILISSVADLIGVIGTLLEASPRCMTFLPLCIKYDNSNEMFLCKEEALLKNGDIDYIVSLVVEERCVIITFNGKNYRARSLKKLLAEIMP